MLKLTDYLNRAHRKLVELSKVLTVLHIPAEKAPTAVVNLIGRKQYARCAKDIYYFSQVGAFYPSNVPLLFFYC